MTIQYYSHTLLMFTQPISYGNHGLRQIPNRSRQANSFQISAARMFTGWMPFWCPITVPMHSDVIAFTILKHFKRSGKIITLINFLWMLSSADDASKSTHRIWSIQKYPKKHKHSISNKHVLFNFCSSMPFQHYLAVYFFKYEVPT